MVILHASSSGDSIAPTESQQRMLATDPSRRNTITLRMDSALAARRGLAIMSARANNPSSFENSLSSQQGTSAVQRVCDTSTPFRRPLLRVKSDGVAASKSSVDIQDEVRLVFTSRTHTGAGKSSPTKKRLRLPTEKRRAQNRANQRASRERRELVSTNA